MNQLKTYLLLFLFIIPYCGHSQITLKDIPPSFNLFEFHPDSTLKTACQTKNNLLNGWAIEFDEQGNPSGIGKYKKNVKKGKWHYSDCVIIKYKGGCYTVFPPPYCGISDMQILEKFYTLVKKHLNHKK
ncbi:MAG: hypothetical protein ACI8ZM_001203 [Crocinitomix sp.]|jgi:hypothetical protein